MKFEILQSKVSGLVLGLTLVSSVAIAGDFPEVTVDGLRKIAESANSVVYSKDDVDLGVYSRVYLVDATVAFKKNWQREHNRSTSNRVRASDMDRIKAGLAELFREVFTETLTAAGYEMATESAEDVVIVRPAIINLDVKAPDTRSTGRSQTYVQSAGQMTLYVELYDSVTGDLLVKVIDTQADRERHNLQWQTKGSNRIAAKKMLGYWADRLSSALSDANDTATGSDEAE